MADLAADVRAARIAAGLSQDGLAILAGVSVRTVKRCEAGQPIGLQTALAILRVLFGDDRAVTALSPYVER